MAAQVLDHEAKRDVIGNQAEKLGARRGGAGRHRRRKPCEQKATYDEHNRAMVHKRLLRPCYIALCQRSPGGLVVPPSGGSNRLKPELRTPQLTNDRALALRTRYGQVPGFP